MEFRVIRSSEWSDVKPSKVENIYKKANGDENSWYIEINTIEELIEFYKKYGNLIISQNWNNKKEMQIEIYDDYRE